MVTEITVATNGQGLFEFTQQIERLVRDADTPHGLCTLLIRHTSASLTIQENADPSARHDLEQWLQRLVPEHDPHYTHTSEGPDDMPAHIKAALTSTTLGIPFDRHRLLLGTWQGIYLWEHRRGRHQRRVALHIGP